MNYIDSQVCQSSEKERQLLSFGQCAPNLSDISILILSLSKQIETQEKLIRKQEEQIRFLSHYIENSGMKYDEL